MPRRLETEIKHTAGKHYLFFDPEHDELVRNLKPDTPEFTAWLASLKSFHFEGKEGRFTARCETRKNKGNTIRKETYWSAYRKHNHKQLRKYLGTTDTLSIEVLENAAKHLTDICNSLPPKGKGPRKSPEKREILFARIAIRDKTIAERDETIEQLRSQIEARDQTLTEQRAQIQRLEAALKAKREMLEL